MTGKGSERDAVQLPLRAEGIQEIYVFHAGTYPIYPEDGHRGAPTQDFRAEKIGRNVKGLTVLDDGTVSEINGNPQELIQALIEQFVQLSGLIVKKTMEPLLNIHSSGNSPIPLPVNPIVDAAQVQNLPSSPPA